MKRIMYIALILICVMSLVGCGRSMNDVIGKEPDFVGIVQEVTDDYLIVNVNEDDVVYENCPVIQVSLDVEIKDSYLDYSVGDEVVVYYDGNIKDGNPAIVNKVYALTLRTPANREQNAVAPNKCLDEVAGNMTFYEEPVKEAQNGTGTVTVRLSRDLNEEQADKLKDILDDVDEWVDDHSVDRLAYYFDGDFQLSDREHSYYFTYEYNVIYYDHYFAEIPADDMQYIKDLGAECVELPDIETNSISFNDLAPGAEAAFEKKIEVLSDDSELSYTLTYGRAAISLEIGLRSEDGTELSTEITGGDAKGVISNVPAGTYTVFLRNIEEVNQEATESPKVTGALHFYISEPDTTK